MDVTIDLRDLLKKIGKKWPVLLILALAGAVALNSLAAGKSRAASAYSAELHARYEEAAPELPAYYNEELFRLRTSLSKNDALFCEAYADIYKDYIAEYQAGTLTDDGARLQAYMLFLDSYKDVLSVFSGTQRAYFNALILTDTASAEKGAPVAESVPEMTAAFSPKWALIGALAGTVVGAVLLAVPYLLTKKLRNPGDLEQCLGIPVLTALPGADAEKGAEFVSAGIAVLMKNSGASSLILTGVENGDAVAVREKVAEKLSGLEIQITEVNILSADPSAVRALGSADAAVIVEKTGVSHYSDIVKEAGICSRYGVRLLGSVVLE